MTDTNQPIEDNTNIEMPSLADLERRLKEQAAAVKEQVAAVKDLEEKLRLARGTHNKLRAPAQDLRGRIEELLSQRPRSQDEVATELSEPAGRVSEVFKELKPRLKNLGTEDRPAWWLVPGNSVSTAELNEAVLALMSYRPVSFKELTDYTGAKSDRVAGAVGIAVKTRSVVNMNEGTPLPARWILVPPASLTKLK